MNLRQDLSFASVGQSRVSHDPAENLSLICYNVEASISLFSENLNTIRFESAFLEIIFC